MNREPCPVCGHPTGDCAGEVAAPTKILGAQVFPSLGYSDVFVVEEDVYGTRSIVQGQEWNPEGISKKTKLFSKGDVIPLAVAVKYGLASA